MPGLVGGLGDPVSDEDGLCGAADEVPPAPPWAEEPVSSVFGGAWLGAPPAPGAMAPAVPPPAFGVPVEGLAMLAAPALGFAAAPEGVVSADGAAPGAMELAFCELPPAARA